MREIRIIHAEIITCIHCNGSGICAHADVRHYLHEGYCLTCSRCGRGNLLFKHEGTGMPEKSSMRPPVCAVCHGTGKVVIG